MTVLLGLTPPIALALWFVMAGRRAEKANALLPRYLLAYQKLCDAPDVDHRVLLAIQVTFESACGFCTGASLLLAKLRPRERSARVAAEIWVKTSMQYVSWSTIRCRPRTWPSMRLNRPSTACLSPA